MTLIFPRVSVVVTVKNEEENIAALLDSISNLDYSGDIETIIVDGGSSDETTNIICSYPFVKLITAKCNISEGRNIGIENSNGEIIAFTDGDCVVDRNWIKNIVKHFSIDSEIAVVGGPYIAARQNGIVANYLAVYQDAFFPACSGFTTYQHIAAGNSAFRREIIKKVGGFDPHGDHFEDDDLNFRVSELGHKLFFAEDVVVYHKYRLTLKQASKVTLERSKAYSVFNRKHKRYRQLLFPYVRTSLLILVALLIIEILKDEFILVSSELVILFLAYYLYSQWRYRRIARKPQMSLGTRLALPLVDLCIRLLESLGSLIGLMKI
jgi:glycosyltransferase involved in cell wall biosynthesis